MRLVKAFFSVLLLMGTLTVCSPHHASKYYLFVGTYTDASSKGIYVYTFDTDDGHIDSVGATATENPSYLAIASDQKHLYAVNEMSDSARASVSSFSFDRSKGTLAFLNKQPTRGAAPCYVSLDSGRNALFTANYSGGSFTMFPLKKDGTLAPPVQIIAHHGSSINNGRQQQPHVHCTILSPDESHLFVTDLGTDQVYGYAFEASKPALSKTPVSIAEEPAGSGPRHLLFNHNGSYAYLEHELDGSVTVFSHKDGNLHAIQNVSAVPKGYKGQITGADIHISPDGKFLYVSNREDLHDIVIFSIDKKTGKLTFVARHKSGGKHPRNFMIDATGQYLLVANRDTNDVVVFKRDEDTGKLTATGIKINVSHPVCLKMMPFK